MRRFCMFLVALLLLPFLAPDFSKAQTSKATLYPVILGYYPAWDTGVTPAMLNYKLFTHICQAFITADESGNLKMEGTMPSSDFTARAHAAGVKVLLSLGGENSGKVFNSMSRDTDTLKKFVEAVMEVLTKYHYDGVDVDWEFPETDGDKDNLVAMVSLFRQTITKQAPGFLLTMAVPAGDWSGKWYDGEKLLPLVDFVNVMTYDFHGDWGTSGYNASMYHDPKDKTDESTSVEEGMNYWLEKKEWPKQKLVVGIPLYGHGFHAKHFYDKPAEKSKYTEIPYKDVLKLIDEGWQRTWDSTAGVPYLTNKEGTELISYDDPESVQEKAKWTKKQGFRGFFFWDITEDNINSDNVLVKTARAAYVAK